MSEQIDYNNFDSKPMILLCGEDRKPLYIPETILRGIPFFAKALQHSMFSAAHTREFDLHDCDAKAVADVMSFIAANDLKPIEEASTHNDGVSQDLEVARYVRAWMVADRFGSERLANDLVDAVVEHHEGKVLNPSLVGILVDADYDHSSLCTLMIWTVAYKMCVRGYEDWTGPCVNATTTNDPDSGVDYQSFRQMCEGMPQTILCRIISISQKLTHDPVRMALNQPCKFHKHDVGNACGQSEAIVIIDDDIE